MDANTDCTNKTSHRESATASRKNAAETVQMFDALDSPWISRSRIARTLQVPNSTLQARLQQRQQRIRDSQWAPQVVQFLECPAGLELLHRLLTAAHLVFVQANDCGIRSLCWFLQLSQLDEFIASSYGAQQAVAEEMESHLIEFGQQEGQRLAAGMPDKKLRREIKILSRHPSSFKTRSSRTPAE